jgi:FixJ family two-component response regulator
MYARKVLIVEDHQESRESLATVLKRARFDVLEAGSLKTAFSLISDGQIAAIVTELKLSDGDGLSLLGQLKKNGRECPIVFVTAFGTMSSAIQAMKMGAADFLMKPVTAKDLTEAVSTALRRWDQQHGREALETSAHAIQSQNVVIGVSRAMRELFLLVERVAPYAGNVLICGESGSGKEVIAREIHRLPTKDHRLFRQLRIRFRRALENELLVTREELSRAPTREKLAYLKQPTMALCFSMRSMKWGLDRRPSCFVHWSARNFVGSGEQRKLEPTCGSSPPRTLTWKKRSGLEGSVRTFTTESKWLR